MKMVYVCMPSKGMFEKAPDGRWLPTPDAVKAMAMLHLIYPNDFLICPSFQNYAILHGLEKSEDKVAFDFWENRRLFLLRRSDLVVNVVTEHSEKSNGVSRELLMCKVLNLKVEHQPLDVLALGAEAKKSLGL
jgi:hypothetical protein